MVNWSEEWKKNLTKSMYIRLCECRNIKSDIVPMAKVVKKLTNKNSQEALDYMLEWICDWNSQVEIYPNDEEYEKMLKMLDK